jgi:ApbE superfamily uncharacterized protein (UPF0280 family)
MEWKLDYGDSHISVSAEADFRSKSLEELISQYGLLLSYINRNPVFKSSYEPVVVGEDAPLIVKRMAEACRKAGVGPMASVAGTIAQLIAERLISGGCKDIVVDNGGDIYMSSDHEKLVAVYAGKSPLSGKIAFRVQPNDMPCGVCTSSASVGPSISLGHADAVTVFADSGALADACATAVGNAVGVDGDFSRAFARASGIVGLRGVLIIRQESLGAWGRLPAIVDL